MPGLSFACDSGGRLRRSKPETVPGCEAELHHMPHAEGRDTRSSFSFHGPPDSHRPARRKIPRLGSGVKYLSWMPARAVRLEATPSPSETRMRAAGPAFLQAAEN